MIRPPRSMAAHALTLAAAVAGAATPAPTLHGLDLAGIDRLVAPGDDFFRYANGAWLKATDIPPDLSGHVPEDNLPELTGDRAAHWVPTRRARPPAPSRARSAITTRASWTRPGSRKRASNPCSPPCGASTPSRTARDWRRRWAQRCAPMSMC